MPTHTKRCPDCGQTLRPRGQVHYCANCETIFEVADLRPEPALEADRAGAEEAPPSRTLRRRELFDG